MDVDCEFIGVVRTKMQGERIDPGDGGTTQGNSCSNDPSHQSQTDGTTGESSSSLECTAADPHLQPLGNLSTRSRYHMSY